MLQAVEIERERVRSAAAAVRAVEEAQAQRRTKLAEGKYLVYVV